MKLISFFSSLILYCHGNPLQSQVTEHQNRIVGGEEAPKRNVQIASIAGLLVQHLKHRWRYMQEYV